jgi:hypothetical protein
MGSLQSRDHGCELGVASILCRSLLLCEGNSTLYGTSRRYDRCLQGRHTGAGLDKHFCTGKGQDPGSLRREHQRILDDFTEAQADYSKVKADNEVNIKRWSAEALQAKNIGQMMPASSAPKAPIQPDGGYNAPANLFNGLVAPLIPYAIKGIIWYQGESNADKITQAIEYATLFRMIFDWRERWGQGNFPFLFVQLPNFNALAKTPSEGIWPWLREAQLKTLSCRIPAWL